MHTHQVRFIVGLSTLALPVLSFAQSTGGNPLNTLPPIHSPQPAPQPATIAPDTALQTEKQLNARQLQLSTLITPQRIDISGVNAIAFAEVAALFQPLAGKPVSIAHLALAAQAATQLYQKAGYPLSFVYLPTQTFENGIVRVIAVEGYVQQVRIEGDPGRSADMLQAMAQPILDDKPLQGEVFTRQTLLMSRMSHLKVKAQANLPQNTDGATPLVLEVEREPVVFNLSADVDKDDPKAIANLTLNEPLWTGSQLQFAALLDNPDKERFISAAWNQWLNAKGTTMRLSFSDFKGSDNSSYFQYAYDDTTYQRKLDLGISHPWQLSAQGSTIIGANLYGLNYRKAYYFQEFDEELGYEEKVRALQAHIHWQRSSTYMAHNARLAFTQGLNALGAGSSETPGLLPSTAKFNFSRLNLDYEARWRTQSLWGAGFAISGQISPDTVPTSERISFGSWRFGRGYLAGEAAGDQGVGVSLEMNRMFSFPSNRWIKTLEPYLLFEEARTWFHESAYRDQTLRSTSLGVRFGDQRYYSLDLSVSKPQGDRSPQNPARKLRYGLALTYQFGK